MPPTLVERSYWSMYTFGNHIKILNVEEHLITFDSGVAAPFEHECISRSND
jgi:hypothetical protein